MTWEEVINEEGISERFKKAVRLLMKPDSIDPVLFFSHADVTKARERHFMYDDGELAPTFLEYVKFEWQPGRAIPEWFCCAYPDVAKWGSHPDSKLDERLGQLSDADLNDRGNLKLPLLRRIVDI